MANNELVRKEINQYDNLVQIVMWIEFEADEDATRYVTAEMKATKKHFEQFHPGEFTHIAIENGVVSDDK
jgi:hypothetical protein